MPDTGHPQQPPDDQPPPCDCGGCREARAIYAEPRREYPREQREIDRALAAERSRRRQGRAA